jgi:two-component system response regulator RpfG
VGPDVFEAVSRLLTVVEAKEPGIQAHTMRVSRLAMGIARQLDVPRERLPVVAFGALLHDVGKIDIPDSVLSKPGPLTSSEQAIMREHSLGGWRLLSEFPLLKDVAVIARSHHERYEGSGYPDGLVGPSIPLEARIVTAADVYDALSSDRCYRTAWSRDRVEEEIIGQRGRLLDPDCVDALFRIIR